MGVGFGLLLATTVTIVKAVELCGGVETVLGFIVSLIHGITGDGSML